MRVLKMVALCAVPLTLDMLVGKQLAGGWQFDHADDEGNKTAQSLILKADGTYENYISSSGPNKPPISANGRGYWFARVGADGAIELALGGDKDGKDPSWSLRALADGTLQNGEQIWHLVP